MGRICRVLKNYKQAITYLQRSIRRNPTTLNHYWLARCYHQIADYKEALKNYELILERETQPQIVNRVITFLQELYEKEGEFYKTLKLIDKQISMLESVDIQEKAELFYKKANNFLKLSRMSKNSKKRRKYKNEAIKFYKKAFCINGHTKSRLKLMAYPDKMNCDE